VRQLSESAFLCHGFYLKGLDMNEKQIATRVSVVTMVLNTILALGKIATGIIYNSVAMVSDGIHSASDVLSTFIVIIGFYISKKDADKKHPYGHERYECVAALILALMLVYLAYDIALRGINVISGKSEVIIPGKLTLVAAVISIVVKEWMYHYTKGAAIKIDSGALLADAWHHRSDALSSVGAFIGIYFARHGFPLADAIASIVIALIIFKVAFEILKDNLDKMLDVSSGEEFEKELREEILNFKEVKAIDSLKTRMFASRVNVDLVVVLDCDSSLIDAENICNKLETKLKDKYSKIKDINIRSIPGCDKYMTCFKRKALLD